MREFQRRHRETAPNFQPRHATAARFPPHHVALLNALDLRLRAAEIVVTGPDAGRLAKVALQLPYLDRVVLRASNTGDLPSSHPAQEKLKAAPESAAFVCVGERCSLPVTDAAQIAAAVSAMQQ